MKLHPVEVLGREEHGRHVLLRYRWTGEAPRPGQFVMARPQNHAGLDPFLPRPLFAHDHEGETVSLLFEVRGRGTALLAGEDAGLLVSAPLGRGFGTEGSGPVALIGGGVWVSPLKLLSRRLKGSGVDHDVYLEVPEGAPEAYAEFLRTRYESAALIETGGASDPPRAVLDRVGELSGYATLYVSGTAETLQAAKHAAEGVVSAQLALRERMACANGSCYGCAVPVWEAGEKTYRRACVEGPVFRAEALAW
ncbi:MAG: hypothetical protein CYG60_20275 [Actinobacteria bacterium]|nr:MAG: hypothetical protein CYG60_20275 [Actinomycetota bacterium]